MLALLTELVIAPAEPFCEWPPNPIDSESEGSVNLPVGSIWFRSQLKRQLHLHIIKLAFEFGLSINFGIKQFFKHIDPCRCILLIRCILRLVGIVLGW